MTLQKMRYVAVVSWIHIKTNDILTNIIWCVLFSLSPCVCVCVCACVRACVCVCVYANVALHDLN